MSAETCNILELLKESALSREAKASLGAKLGMGAHAQLVNSTTKTVVVGMSGGVDSSVTALILKKLGYKVVGLFMKNWEETDQNGNCTSEKDFKDVAAVCTQLDIPYQAVDFVETYRKNVFEDFLKEYKRGRTPNPDILCNKEIKFKVFYDMAMKLGADYLATGHYCQTNGTNLLKGYDPNKDQSYFLHAINQKVLDKVLFPLGALLKPQVREIATTFNLATKAKKDSTGICFIGERDFREFLKNYIAAKPGPFRTLDEKEVGSHQGVAYYTLGQRKKLGLGGPGDRWFVVKKDPQKNIVYVERGTEHPQLYSDYLECKDISFLIKESEISFPYECSAKIRYRQKDTPCTLTKDKQGYKVCFPTPQRAIATGQSVVFYQGNQCIGGGVIEAHGATYFELGRPLPMQAMKQ